MGEVLVFLGATLITLGAGVLALYGLLRGWRERHIMVCALAPIALFVAIILFAGVSNG